MQEVIMRKGFINCKIWNSGATAFLLDEGRFVKLGNDADITKLTGSDELIDLKGMFVVPGFVDSHMHLAELGYYLSMVQLIGLKDKEDLKEKILAYQKKNPEATWIIGRGWDDSVMERPERSVLDEICQDLPVALTRIDGHVMAVNTKAMQEAGIDENTVIEGGTVDYEKGILEENAITLIQDALPVPKEAAIRSYIEKGSQMANQCGITTVGSDDFLAVTRDYRPVLNVFEQMSYQEALHVRVNEQCEFKDIQQYAAFLDDGYTMDVGNDYFKIGPLKLIADGTLGAETAAVTEAYLDHPERKGMMTLSEDEISLFTELAARYNMGVIVHAIGDAAVDSVLKAFQEFVLPGNPLHHGLVHCQILRQDQIQRILQMQLSCYFQSLFEEEDGRLLEERIGKERSSTCYPFTTLLRGTVASNGSDAPVCMPYALHGISLAVNGAEGIKETMSAEEALSSYTVKGAEQLFMQAVIGKIAEGYYADFAVLDKDICSCDPKEIDQTKVMMTVMNGETVFER
jgi:predicted amidohydrolase YtcJ